MNESSAVASVRARRFKRFLTSRSSLPAALVAAAFVMALVALIFPVASGPGRTVAWLSAGLVVTGAWITYMAMQVRGVSSDPAETRERNIRMLVGAVVALFAGAVIANLFFSLRRGQDEVLHSAGQNAGNLAQVLERQVSVTFDAIDTAMRDAARALPARGAADPVRVRHAMATAVNHEPALSAMWFVDADGAQVADSGDMPGHAVRPETNYLRAHRSERRAGLYIGRPVESDGGQSFIPVSRRIEHADGRFAGVLAAALRPDALARLSRTVEVGEDGFVGFARLDGTPLQHTDTFDGDADAARTSMGQFAPRVGRDRGGIYRDAGPHTPAERLVAWHRIEGRPAVVMVALGVDEALAAWRRTAATYLAGSLVFLLLITGLGLRLLHELRQRQSHQSRIDQLNRTRAILSGATSMIMRAGTRSELFEGACRVAVRLGQFDVAWVDVFDQDTGRPMPVASAGADAAFILQGDRLDAGDDEPLASGLATEAWRSQGTVASNTLAARPDHSPRRARALQRGYRSAITLPLSHGNGVVAALTLLARPEGFFDADEVRLLDDLADDLSHALEHLASLERIEYLALYDVLTGLPNRALFVDRTLHALQGAASCGTQCALVKLDIERFRQINGTVGRQAGDGLIALIAARLADTLGHDGLLSRPERDHFMFVLGGLESEAEAASALQQVLHACFEQPFHIEGHDLHLSARAGVAVYPNDGEHPDTLLANAEAALARAKHTGERMTFYTPKMNARAAESLRTENKLRGALERDQFVLHYQPKFDARSGALVGLEGLIRWEETEGELVAPAQFVPLLEETGLILPVGEWVMQQALRDWRRWRDLGLDPPRIAVNVSALQLRQESFAQCVHDVLADDGERVLELEITESMLMTRVESNADTLDAIRDMGVHIAIDDFGTGYSSLQYIAKLPLDTLKIDRSFVVGMTTNPTDREIVASVISLAHQLHLKVVAEGVDSQEQAQMLRELHCDEMQGYLFSPPLPPDQIQGLMRRRYNNRAMAVLH